VDTGPYRLGAADTGHVEPVHCLAALTRQGDPDFDALIIAYPEVPRRFLAAPRPRPAVGLAGFVAVAADRHPLRGRIGLKCLDAIGGNGGNNRDLARLDLRAECKGNRCTCFYTLRQQKMRRTRGLAPFNAAPCPTGTIGHLRGFFRLARVTIWADSEVSLAGTPGREVDAVRVRSPVH